MDSDDDFGDFTFVPADVSSAPIQFSSQLDAGTSFNTSAAASTIRPTESNSDDDWGDFVEHSSLAVCDNSQVLDWFAISFPSQANASLSSTDRKDGVEDAERKTDDFESSAWNLKGSKEVHATVGSCPSNNEMALGSGKMQTYKRSVLNEMNSLPIPLSLFGDGELETGNLKTDLVNSATSLFQEGHVRNTGARTSKDLSNLIANLYTEAQSLPSTKKSRNVSLNEIDNSMNKEEGGFGYHSSPAGGSCNLEISMLALNLGLENTSDTGLSKGDICRTAAGVELEATTSVLLDSISMVDQCAFVEAWASMLAVCASELEFALQIWKQAQCADVHLALLADLQGKQYFAAIGQIYVVVLVLAATSNVYKPWLQVAVKKGKSLQTDLERCRAVWLESNLKEGVQLALDGLEGSMPTSVIVPWKGIEQFSSVALEACIQAAAARARASLHSMCKICLLPMAPFRYSGLHPVEWSGSSYLLPLANLWANCVSQKPPSINLSI